MTLPKMPQGARYQYSQIIMVDSFPSIRPTAHALEAYREKQDRRTLAKYPGGFIRGYVPGEFAPYSVDRCHRVAVVWSAGKVLRVSVGPCRMAAGWREDFMDTGLPAAPVEAGWGYAQEEALHNAGERPRQAPAGVRKARHAAWDVEEALFLVAGGYKAIPWRVRQVWAKKNVIPLLGAEEVDGE